ncbi:MAG: type VI secretion system baseplate subunit TssE [Sedimentisphaerales bacterium]|nr:type VI secretion system baseplate subunit TssE [Sedimentisphaerales bacterium]
MAEITSKERLQPCLLDRLTDDNPESRQESRDQRIISLRRYKTGVLRDLSWLLNTSSHSSDGLFDGFPEAFRSVLNFGVPDLCGLTASSIKSGELESQVLHAIRLFEPRITHDTLGVRVRTSSANMDHNAIAFEIRGELWAQPMSDTLFVRTEVDLDTGQCNVEE